MIVSDKVLEWCKPSFVTPLQCAQCTVECNQTHTLNFEHSSYKLSKSWWSDIPTSYSGFTDPNWILCQYLQICRHFLTNARESEKFPGGLECFQMTRKASRWPGNFPDGLETSRWPGNFLDGLETFQLAWKLSTWPRNFPHGLESVHMVWKVSRFFGQFYAICPGKFPDDLKSFPSISQVFTLPRLCSLCLCNLF